MIKWIPGEVVRKKRWADGIYSLYIKAEIDPFIAGQFARIALDTDEARISRPYSYANSPDEKLIEIYFVVIPHGTFTPKLASLEPGDFIWVEPKPAGFFTLQPVLDASVLWLMSSGTALAGYLSMLKTKEPWHRFKNIVLVHAVRLQSNLTHQELINDFLQEYREQFHYVPVVSREVGAGFLLGRIPKLIEENQFEQKTSLALSKESSQVMICGNPALVHDTTRCLENRGFRKHTRRNPGNIHVENYWKEHSMA
ncbi:MAG TPA: ferredoxin--NADP reductase [Gammaproteobacteria bacterium]|nr:ferredoxin--NADP reductase [Gammaproteobacteria bacterium]